jgi:hypothetical protein
VYLTETQYNTFINAFLPIYYIISPMASAILLLGTALVLTVDKVREHKGKKRALETQEATSRDRVEFGNGTGHEQLPAYDGEGLPAYCAAETRSVDGTEKRGRLPGS